MGHLFMAVWGSLARGTRVNDFEDFDDFVDVHDENSSLTDLRSGAPSCTVACKDLGSICLEQCNCEKKAKWASHPLTRVERHVVYGLCHPPSKDKWLGKATTGKCADMILADDSCNHN